jgi:PilZ domain-containing protein
VGLRERRRSQRVTLRVSVTIHLTAVGKATAIRSFTIDVNVHGALLVSPQSFPAGTHFMLENDRTRERMMCRVVRMPKSMPEGFHIPVEFEKSAPNFWKISFPPPDWKPLES